MSNKSATSNQVISLPKGGGSLQGLGETFSPDLHSGTGNYQVPIALPPGRNGFQPSLNLSYSSGHGHSSFGLGWELNIPQIVRKTSKGIPRYDNATDTFILSGTEDLVPVETLSGITQYRPRTEGLFARIEHHRDARQDYWKVYSKDGLESVYGTPRPEGVGPDWQDPAVVADPENRRAIFAWKLSRTVDPFGNIIEYDNERDLTEVDSRHWDQLYLKRIRYVDWGDKANPQFLVSTTFEYEDRPDAFSDYRSGFEIRTRRRCNRIVVRTHADAERRVKTYDLVYLDRRTDIEHLDQLLPLNKFSLLSRIIVTGHDDEQVDPDKQVEILPPLEFGYTSFEPQKREFFPLEGKDLPAQSLAHPALEVADLFGNGLPDILEMNGTVRYWRNLGGGRYDLPKDMRQAPAGVTLADPGVQLVDANGDGRVDLLVHRPGQSGYFPLHPDGLWEQSSFQPYDVAPSVPLEGDNIKALDLNGDGVTDIVRFGHRIECFEQDPERGWHTHYLGNIDDPQPVNPSDPRVKWGDMTGDGLQDIILVHDGNIVYWPNLGYGRWGKKIVMANSPRFRYGYDPKHILVGDVDGDGLDDVVYVDDRKVIVWINQSGNGWSEPIEIQGTPSVSDMDAVRLLDMLGSGIQGLLWSTDANGPSRPNLFFLDFTDGTKPYLLNEMDNHMGAITRVGYTSSTQFYEADRERPGTRWKTTLPFPVLVVHKVERVDQISRGKLTTEYRYRHGYWDGAEREFRGFGMVEQRDTERFEDYHQAGLHGQEMPFLPVDGRQHFSPPTITKTWFHQGPVGDAVGGWYELDYRDEFFSEDPQVLGRPADMRAALNDLPRRAKRDALRTLRGHVMRTEFYALDGSEREARPYTVTESLYGVREEAPPARGTEDRQRIFFSHPLAQRTTQWERGDDPMTRFDFRDDYDAYGQSRSQTTIAVPRSRQYQTSATATEPYLATHTRTDFAQPTYEPMLTEMAGLEATERGLRKTTPMGWDNSGAVSIDFLAAGEDGWVTASCPTPGLRAMFGLSTASSDNHFNSIDYGVYFSGSPSIMVYEKGTYRKGGVDLTTDDVVKIERRGNQILYKRNEDVFYRSEVASETALVVDLAFYDPGAELANLRCSKPTHSPRSVNGVRFLEVDGLAFDGTTIRKQTADSWNDGGAISANAIPAGDDGWVAASTSTPGLRAFVGLSTVNTNRDYASVDYSAYFYIGSIYIFEKGVAKRQILGVSEQERIRIERVGTTIRYLHNGDVVYTSETPSETDLYVDLSIHDRGSELENLQFSHADDVVRPYLVDRVARTTRYEVLNDGSQSVFALYNSIQAATAATNIIGQSLHYYDGEAFVGLPWGEVGAFGAQVRSESLVLTEDILQAAYGAERPPYLNPEGAIDWTEAYPEAFRNELPTLAGYRYHAGGEIATAGYFAPSGQQQYDFQTSSAGPVRGLLQVTRNPLGGDTQIAYDTYDFLATDVRDAIGLNVSASYDYRVFEPREACDVNGNRNAYRFTPLGLLASTAIMGKVDETIGDHFDLPGTPAHLRLRCL